MNKVLIGDCRESMKQLIADGVKVQMCVTSPPYWGLRDYGHADQLGLEPTPEEYVANMVEVFRLVRELLKDDGTLWLNLGDTYSSSGAKGQGEISEKQLSNKGSRFTAIIENGRRIDGIPPKNLVGIPWMVAFALRADGWYLRQDIIWHKPNPMPESVTDRCTKSHEYIFLMSKNSKYYYDYKAIQELANYDGRNDTMMKGSMKYQESCVPGQTEHTMAKRGHERWNENEDGEKVRNKRSVWTVTTKPYSEAHFATFPPDLITPCILAGSKTGDIVLDPFFGSGTTGQVSELLGRQWIGCELNDEYKSLWEARTAQCGLAL